MTQPETCERCPKCGEPVRRDTYQVGDRHLQRWLCGTSEHVSGRLMVGETCYERQLSALRAELEAAKRDTAYVLAGYERSEFDSAPCPGCVYDNGTFIRSCHLHQRLAEKEAEAGRLREAMAKLVAEWDLKADGEDDFARFRPHMAHDSEHLRSCVRDLEEILDDLPQREKNDG